ncbi:molybdopterin-dependent oxidoreductase [Kitasatospora sp. NBC_00374]|uniref:molybdopterin-dependent oxidoreductase n=1 Tax=Kitasatospora sp. NBC_00374 TaxID=2975964 RepID=UPI00324452D7
MQDVSTQTSTPNPAPAAVPRSRRSRPARAAAAAGTGLAAAAAAVGAGELVAAFTGPDSAPVIAVGSAAIDLTPTPLKEYAVRTFGTNDKPVLLGGIYLTMTALAALAGVVAARRPAFGAAVFAAFGALGALAALSRPTAIPVDALPSVVAGLVGAGAMVLLARLLRTATTVPAPEPAGPSRRAVLAATGGTVAFAALSGFGGRSYSDSRTDVSAARDAVRLPAPATRSAPPPAAAHPGVPGLTSFQTPNPDFYRVDTALTLPKIDPRHWTLRLHGLVDHPVVISFDELLKRPLQELDYTLTCVSNEVGGPYASTARWLGVSLPDLLRQAGVRSGADQLVGRSKDGMTIGTPLDALLDGRDALLAVAMNGEVLPVAHGFPCRTLVPGLYGYTSATKWLVDLEVTTFAGYDAYWVERGWDRTGTVRTASRIEVPAAFAKVPAGDVTVAGTAWATHRGIAAVEVRVDGGPWAEARLAADAGPDLWRQWSHDWTGARPGTHRIEVRATDAGGAVQPEARAAPFPAGATGWHSTVVTVT